MHSGHHGLAGSSQLSATPAAGLHGPQVSVLLDGKQAHVTEGRTHWRDTCLQLMYQMKVHRPTSAPTCSTCMPTHVGPTQSSQSPGKATTSAARPCARHTPGQVSQVRLQLHATECRAAWAHDARTWVIAHENCLRRPSSHGLQQTGHKPRWDPPPAAGDRPIKPQRRWQPTP